jgi:hypothetical protein
MALVPAPVPAYSPGSLGRDSSRGGGWGCGGGAVVGRNRGVWYVRVPHVRGGWKGGSPGRGGVFGVDVGVVGVVGIVVGVGVDVGVDVGVGVGAVGVGVVEGPPGSRRLVVLQLRGGALGRNIVRSVGRLGTCGIKTRS